MVEVNWENNACVICGEKNPHGIRLHFEWLDGKMRTFPTVGAKWQGFDGLVHGGIITGMMDDAMWHAIYREHGATSLTAALNVRFLRPVRVNSPLAVAGWADTTRSRLITARAEIRDRESFELLAAAEGRFMKPRT